MDDLNRHPEWTFTRDPEPSAEADAALPDLHPVNVGARYPQFDNGRSDQVFAIEVDHPSGRWEQIWVLRDSALADRIVAALSRPATPPLDVERPEDARWGHEKHTDEYAALATPPLEGAGDAQED